MVEEINKKLAIIIPAYKIDFFKETLDSLAAQTCKDFTVYIGEDCSSSDFVSLINEYQHKINLVYKRFDTNLGGHNLVAQWERCIKMTQGEPWLWLFSDDDILGNKCVELFYKEIEKETIYDIYHFDVKVINSDGLIVKIPHPYPCVFNALDFYKKKTTGEIESFVVENIFSREIYNQIGGFIKFDMAWGSDTATWVNMSLNKGLKKIDGDFVRWRKSGMNITPNNSRQICIRKIKANVEFSKWAYGTFSREKIHYIQLSYLMRRFYMYLNILDFNDVYTLLKISKEKKIMSKMERNMCYVILCLLKILK